MNKTVNRSRNHFLPFLPCAAMTTVLSAGQAFAAPTLVTNGDNDGEGSLRAALESGAAEIMVTTRDDILITAPLTYGADKPLAIYGNGQTIRAMQNFDLLQVSSGADLTVIDLDFEGPGGFDIANQVPAGESAGKGIFVDVGDDQSGTVDVMLSRVSVSGVANHGVHVSDCNLADDCGGGGGGAGEGSPASIRVVFHDVNIENVGNGRFDADGLRVDERGQGGISFYAFESRFTGVGADGVELDEGQKGTIRTKVVASEFADNGAYCDPQLLQPQLLEFLGDAPDKAGFEEAEAVLESDIPGRVTGTADDRCFEREVDLYDTGFVEAYEISIDLDDGFDIDEAGDGSLQAALVDSSITGNLDEGVDFDEEDAGSIKLVIVDSNASGNTDDGFKFSEAGGAGVKGVMYRVESKNNGGKGAVFEESNGGSLDIVVADSQTSNNDDSDSTGIEAVQEDAGTGLLTVINSDIDDGIDAEGVEVIEE